MQISSVTTKAGDTIQLNKLTVLVGPNNVGKSRTLRDIQSLMVNSAEAPTTLVKKIVFAKPATFDDILSGVEQRPSPNNIGNRLVLGIGPTLRSAEQFEMNLDNARNQFPQSTDLNYLLGNLAKFHLAFLDAGSRLVVAQQSPSHNPYEAAPSSLLQALYLAGVPKEAKLREAFRQTFDMDLRLDYAGMQALLLRVSREFPELPPDPRDQLPIMAGISKLDEQGDGFRSFVGVVLSVLLSEGRIILLDEPEAFLHPAQARRLGKWLAKQVASGSSQVIVATHNANFLAGILDADQPVDIYRLNRAADVTSFNHMTAEVVTKISRSPLLSSQRVLEAIFYEGVVVCEADADRALYEAVAVKAHDNRQLLFIHAHNKQSLHTVVELLRPAAIPVVAVSDIDLLNSTSDLKALLLALNPSTEVDPLLARQNAIATAVMGRAESEVLDELGTSVREMIGQLDRNEHTVSGARGALNRIGGVASKWSDAKRNGVSGIPETVRADATSLIADLANLGLFVVPVGELESWIEVGTRRKKKWVIPALEAIANGACPEPLKSFVALIIAKLEGLVA